VLLACLPCILSSQSSNKATAKHGTKRLCRPPALSRTEVFCTLLPLLGVQRCGRSAITANPSTCTGQQQNRSQNATQKARHFLDTIARLRAWVRVTSLAKKARCLLQERQLRRGLQIDAAKEHRRCWPSLRLGFDISDDLCARKCCICT
jgi:hypothetical protein